MSEKSLYFECTSGISGDMAVASLLDAGADEKCLMDVLTKIPCDDGFEIRISDVVKGSVRCKDFEVVLASDCDPHDHDMEYLFGDLQCAAGAEDVSGAQECAAGAENAGGATKHGALHRNLQNVISIIEKTPMSEPARKLAVKIFTILAESESKAHGIPVEEVHFHEVGAMDSIVDVVAFSVCFCNLVESEKISKVYVPFLCEGTGTVRCQHGVLPVPVPAVSNIVSGYRIPLKMISDAGEFVTPTGAAIVAAVATDYSMPENFVIRKTGYGAGKRNYPRANYLRTMILEYADVFAPRKLMDVAPDKQTEDSIIKLETNIDDSTGEALGFVMEELFSAGALDVFYVPCFMKKNRPAYLLTVVCREDKVSELENIIFLHTTTIGIRKQEMSRHILPRTSEKVSTKYGEAAIKVCVLPHGTKRFYPEYESVAELARKNNLPFQEVYECIRRHAPLLPAGSIQLNYNDEIHCH